MAGVTLRGVTKRYGEVSAVDDISLEIPDGSFTVLLGPSGCGKTTTLRMIAGLEEATSGEIMIGDAVVDDLPPAERDIAMVFQSYALYPHMTVADNIAFGLKFRKMTKGEIAGRVADVAEMLDLGPLLNRRPRQLSGGQRQRVALGRAIARRPAVFLMDEPLSNLDARLRTQTRAELIRLHQELGTTIVYVTHDQVEAMTMGQQVVVMDGGHVQQVASPHEVYLSPTNTFVAGFIGSPAMNMIQVSLVTNGRGTEVDLGGVRVPVGVAPWAPPGTTEVLWGVRPEHVALAEEGAPFTVKMTELLGHDTLLHLDGPVQLLARTDSRRTPRSGETVHVTFDIEHAAFFCPATGQRLDV